MAMMLAVLTGSWGFIARHVLLKLLNARFDVRGTVRLQDRADEVRAALAAHLARGAGRPRLVEADREADAGWSAAMSGVAAVVHTTSP